MFGLCCCAAEEEPIPCEQPCPRVRFCGTCDDEHSFIVVSPLFVGVSGCSGLTDPYLYCLKYTGLDGSNLVFERVYTTDGITITMKIAPTGANFRTVESFEISNGTDSILVECVGGFQSFTFGGSCVDSGAVACPYLVLDNMAGSWGGSYSFVMGRLWLESELSSIVWQLTVDATIGACIPNSGGSGGNCGLANQIKGVPPYDNGEAGNVVDCLRCLSDKMYSMGPSYLENYGVVDHVVLWAVWRRNSFPPLCSGQTQCVYTGTYQRITLEVSYNFGNGCPGAIGSPSCAVAPGPVMLGVNVDWGVVYGSISLFGWAMNISGIATYAFPCDSSDPADHISIALADYDESRKCLSDTARLAVEFNGYNDYEVTWNAFDLVEA